MRCRPGFPARSASSRSRTPRSCSSRKVIAITEVQRMESDLITRQDLFCFHVDGFASDRAVLGSLKWTGLRPMFTDKFERRGVELPASLGAQAPHHAARGVV